jgi:hypothetical protein
MKLFDILPDKFFTILSSSNKEIYSDCLFILYSDLKNNTSFGVDREIVAQTLTDYFEGFNEDTIFEDSTETIKTSREKANFVIRKLNDCGWIDIETNTSYKQIINFTDYSIAFLETMQKVVSNEKLEYQGYVYTIYSVIFGSENIQPNVMLEQVYENTNRLMTGLKTLNSNIKKYLEKITHQKTAQEIMDLAFNGYTQDIIDKGYHRLKTSDNVSKFRPKIIDRLEEFKRSKIFLDEVSKQNVEMEKHKSYEEALEDAMLKLNSIIYAFENMDDVINEIDRKNSQYIRASLARMKYLLNSSKDLGGQVTEILKYMVSQVEKNNYDIKEDSLDEVEELFSFFPQSFIDERSIYTATEAKPAFNPQNLNDKKALTKEERESKINDIKERNRIRMSRENIDKYVLQILKDKKVINASSLPVQDVKDYIKIIYILIYSKSRLVHYRVKKLENQIQVSDFTFKDFEIWRK